MPQILILWDLTTLRDIIGCNRLGVYTPEGMERARNQRPPRDKRIKNTLKVHSYPPHTPVTLL